MDSLSQLYLDINGLSRHIDTDEDFNERNVGAGLSYETRKRASDIIKSVGIGGYKNSYGDNSYYAAGGLAKRFGKDLYADVGGVGGVVTGYEGGINPLVMPMVSLGMDDLWKLRMMYAPETKENPATVLMNLGIPFK